MGVIFGNDGNACSKIGDVTFQNRAGGNIDSIEHIGKSAFSRKGTRHDQGDVSFGNSIITKSGDVYFCNGNSYQKCGDVLFGPNGKSWSGPMTDTDIRDIISHSEN